MEKTTRSYDSPLRRLQQENTAKSIMDAVESLILEGRIHKFTIQEVAERAGVSYGAVYRHYPSREALLEGLRQWWLDHHSESVPAYAERLEDLPEWIGKMIPKVYDSFPQVRALLLVTSALNLKNVHSSTLDRDTWVKELVDHAAPGLSPEVRYSFYCLLRHLLSMEAWIKLQSRFGLDQSGLVVVLQTGIRAQIQGLQAAALQATETDGGDSDAHTK